MDTYSPEAGRITTASLRSSDVVEKFAKIHANDSQAQALSARAAAEPTIDTTWTPIERVRTWGGGINEPPKDS